MAKGKDPAFLFYPGDWLGGTMGMTFEEKGAYLEVLVMQWNSHRISESAAKRLVGEDLWFRIAHKFEADGNGFFNKRLETEKIKRRKHSEKQSDNAKKRWGKDKNIGNATAMPLENENINENVIKSESVLKGVHGENWEAIKTKWGQDFRWKEKMCRDKNISMTDLHKKMVEFVSDIELKEDYKDIPGLKSHFVNWYNKHNKNGHSGNSEKLGTSAARIKTAENW